MSVDTERAQWDLAAKPDGHGPGRTAAWEVWSVPDPLWDEYSDRCIDEIKEGLSWADGLTSHRRYLDLGCGIGRAAIPIARWRPDCVVVGVDISANMLDLARTSARVEGVSNVRWLLGDGRLLPNGIGHLTAAWSVVVFQHIPGLAVRAYIGQVSRLLRPGGVFHFQFCEGNESLPPDTVTHWCVEAGIPVARVSHSGLYPNWLWYTTVKP